MSSKIIPGEMILEGSIPDAQLEIPPKKKFTDLDDTPANYTASAGKVLVVNGTPDGIDFTNSPVFAELQVTGRVYSGTLTVTTGAYDALDVTAVNTVFLDCSGGAITIGGLVGGVNGQPLYFARLCASADAITLEHLEGTGNQDIYLHAGADETLSTEYGGWVLVCNGTSWFDTSHSKHV